MNSRVYSVFGAINCLIAGGYALEECLNYPKETIQIAWIIWISAGIAIVISACFWNEDNQ